MRVDPEYGQIIEAEVGETVWDDLTRSNAVIVRKELDHMGNLGYWLDNEYLAGGRYPWEISQPR